MISRDSVRGVILHCLWSLAALALAFNFAFAAYAETTPDAPSAEIAAPRASPRAFQVSYELRHNAMLIARTERSLHPGEDGTWIYESHSTPAGLMALIRSDRINESSVWHNADNTPQPLRYEYHHTGRRPDRHVELDFDWSKGTVAHTINGTPWSMSVPAETVDKLLYQYLLMRDLQNGAQELRYLVADGSGLKTYRFERIGNETVKTPLGPLDTVKLLRVEGGYQTTIWCAPSYDYMPVRVEQYRDHKSGTLMINAIRME